MGHTIVCLLLLCILETFKVISKRVPTCDSVHAWWLYNAASVEHQTTSTMTCYPTQSHYHDLEPTSLYPILIMLNTRLGSDTYQLWSRWFDSTRFRTRGLCTQPGDLQIPQSPRTGGGGPTHSATPSVRQHCRVTMSAHCHKSVDTLVMWLLAFPECKTLNNQTIRLHSTELIG